MNFRIAEIKQIQFQNGSVFNLSPILAVDNNATTVVFLTCTVNVAHSVVSTNQMPVAALSQSI